MQKERLVDKIPDDARPIKNSKDFIDPRGQVYTPVTNYKGHPSGKFIRKTCRIVKQNGYVYCAIHYHDKEKNVQRRVNRLVAEAFIPNPDNLPVVGHRNNIKSDNRVENLYWTTYSENTQKAVDDELLPNDRSRDDSQSKPVAMYDTLTNKCLGIFGSAHEAAEKTGLSLTTICRQAKYHRPVRRPQYFRYLDDKTAPPQQLVGMFEYDTGKLIKLFINTGQAASETNSCEKTISQQCRNGKPKHKFSDYYFGYINSKCEQTIESNTQVE